LGEILRYDVMFALWCPRTHLWSGRLQLIEQKWLSYSEALYTCIYTAQLTC